jgi:hypothetical protein
MTKKADIGSKRLISLNPDAWIRWVTGICRNTNTGNYRQRFSVDKSRK